MTVKMLWIVADPRHIAQIATWTEQDEDGLHAHISTTAVAEIREHARETRPGSREASGHEELVHLSFDSTRTRTAFALAVLELGGADRAADAPAEHRLGRFGALMIAKLGKGEDFGGLARYLTKGGRGQVLDMRNLASADPTAAAGEMQVAAAMSTRCRKPVMHITVSYNPTDAAPTDDNMRADAAELLAALGLADHQAMIIRHSDRDHAHFHITANRIGSDGKAVSDSQSYPRAEAVLRRIEGRRGLSVTQGRHAPSPSTGQRMTGPRGAADPRQHSVPESVRQTLLTARSWKGLHKDLKRDGWLIETTQRGKRPPGAVLIGPDGQRIAAGKIDRGATLSKLNARLADPKQDALTPVSAKAAGKPIFLAKPLRSPRKKTDQRIKDIARIGAKTATQLIGAVNKTHAPSNGLIGATRKATSRTRKHSNASRTLGL
ncbi:MULTISPECIES: relaxase/mobilization nuclease domain-containing protein [Roseobacteraceae]|uniref:relaxase/mobilization nuclease domain-containing protein n=1 Tax=Roseobacteraceae TaxID=2854170 RepID=UPI0031D06BC2